MNLRKMIESLWNGKLGDTLFRELLAEVQTEAQENGNGEIEAEYQVGKERLNTILSSEQKVRLAKLEDYCAEAAKAGLWIAFQRGLYAGFQHFFQRDAEPLTFEELVLNRLLTVPEVMRFPEYDHAQMQVNELETELSEQLDPFSREHLTSITYAWEERSYGLLRHGFALGHQAAAAVIQSAAPEHAAQLTQAGWRTAKETGMTDW